MSRKPYFGVVALVVTLMAPSVLSGVQAPPKRVVTLGILMSNGPKDARPSQITTLEGDMATFSNPDVGQYGLTPAFKPGNDKTVVVTIFDTTVKPAHEIGKVEAIAGGKAVSSKTKPPFDIAVISVIRPK